VGYFFAGTSPPLGPQDGHSPLGQPTADLPPGFGLPALPGVHALLGHDELGELIPRDRLDQAREIGTGASQLEQEGFGGDAGGRRRGRQGMIMRDAAA
jgi:hypothetical protein